MYSATLNRTICVIPAKCWSGLRKNWAMMSGCSALWLWHWAIPVRSSLTICLLAISGEHFSKRYGGLQEKMCTCRALCICWKRIPPSGIACWMNWRQRYMSERRRPCLYCRCLMMSNTVIGPCTTSCFDC